MATWDDVRSIALALPGTVERFQHGSIGWAVRSKGFVWERPLRKSDLAALGAKAPKGAILCARTSDLELKAVLLASDPNVFFTTPHFDGYPAVLVRLGKISRAKLKDVIVEAWLSRASQKAVDAYLRDSREDGPGVRAF